MYVLLILIIVDILGLFSVLKRNDLDPMYKIVFTLCIILLPIVGIIIYYLFSSRRKRKKLIFRNVGGGVLKGDVIERKEGNIRKIAVRLFSVTAIFRNLLNIFLDNFFSFINVLLSNIVGLHTSNLQLFLHQ